MIESSSTMWLDYESTPLISSRLRSLPLIIIIIIIDSNV